MTGIPFSLAVPPVRPGLELRARRRSNEGRR